MSQDFSLLVDVLPEAGQPRDLIQLIDQRHALTDEEWMLAAMIVAAAVARRLDQETGA